MKVKHIHNMKKIVKKVHKAHLKVHCDMRRFTFENIKMN